MTERILVRGAHNRDKITKRVWEISDADNYECILQKYDPPRTLPQNDRVHPMIRAVAQWMGQGERETRYDLCREYRVKEIMGVDGVMREVPWKTTSEMTKSEMSEFQEWLAGWMGINGIAWHE